MNFRELSADRLPEWRAAGFRSRDFFPNRSFHLRKSAPDGYKLAQQSGLRPRPEEMWEILLFALPDALDGLPPELFFDDDVMWHRQQFGLIGQVAVASVMLRGREIHTAAHHSDLVQRISRRREYKTRVESRLQGWDRLLLNNVLAFTIEHEVATVNVPTAAYAKEQTDHAIGRARALRPRLRPARPRRLRGPTEWQLVGDRRRGESRTHRCRHEARRADDARQDDLRVPRHRARPRSPSGGARVRSRRRTTFAASLESMLAAETQRGVTATYNVVGEILPAVRTASSRPGTASASTPTTTISKHRVHAALGARPQARHRRGARRDSDPAPAESLSHNRLSDQGVPPRRSPDSVRTPR